MRKKVCQSVCALALTGTLIMGGIMPVTASSILDEVQSTETDANYAKDISYSLLRGNNLNYGVTDINALSSNEINISGTTQCHRVCDTVYLEIYLEQKSGGDYYSYKSWEFSKENASNLMKSMNVSVPSGHYYRVRGYHAAKEGSLEATSTVTSGVWVG